MRYILILSLPLYLFALTLSVESGSENSNRYSILHIRDKTPFECTQDLDEFYNVIKIECDFDAKSKHRLDSVKNQFLNIKTTSSDSSYKIVVTPKYKMKLIKSDKNLYDIEQVYSYNMPKTKHAIIFGYRDNQPIYQDATRGANSINFPIKIAGNNRPIVESIDLKGNAIKLKASHDVVDYLDMKRAYEAKDYHKVVAIIDKTLDDHPETIFKNEMLLYLIRVNHALGEHEDVIEASKIYLRKYSSDNGTPEVLAYSANAYDKLGQSGEGEYYYDRLIKEYPDSLYVAKAMVMRGAIHEANADKPKAAAYYDMALAKTNDVEIASEAAFGLASLELSTNEAKKARDYVDKILAVNPQFFSKHHDKSVDLAAAFSEKKYPLTAAKITKVLLDSTDKKKFEYEALLRNIGLLYTRGKDRANALKYLNEYLEDYSEGEFIGEIEEAKDRLFFSGVENNATKRLESYDELIDKYRGDEIADRAIYNKAHTLLEQKKYSDVLAMQQQLETLDDSKFPKTSKYLQDAALSLAIKELEANRCADAMVLVDGYKLKLAKKYDEKLFDCMVGLNRYEGAMKLSDGYIKSKDIAQKRKWLVKLAKLNFAQGKYKEAIKISKDVVALMDAKASKDDLEIYRVQFDSARATGDSEMMIKSLKMIESSFRDDFRDIERFVQMINLGIKKRDDSMIQTYATKAINLQDRTKSYSQTPFVEFAYIDSLITSNKFNDALKVANSLVAKKLSANNRARLYYTKGSIEQKLNRLTAAKSSYSESIKISKDSPWAKLAKDALELLK